MPHYSKFDNDLEFNEKEWVVSLINTKSGISSVWGGHAKIVVEGVKKKITDSNSNLFATELFIAEYHIMEANRVPEETWIPQVCRNTKCNYLVLYTERNDYSARQDQQYSSVQSRSVGAINPNDVNKMIQNIKKEQQDINDSVKIADFEYGGKWSYFGENNAHNCTTWAEEKLDIIGLGKHLITDSSKAAPYLHVNSSKCPIL